MTPQLIFWLIWTLSTAGEPVIRTDFSPYDGPLAARLITEPVVDMGSVFTIDADTPELRAFENWLRRHPIFVRAPGHRYIGWGIETHPGAYGEIMVTVFNLLLRPAEQPLGPYLGDGGAMLEWAFSVIDHYGFVYDPAKQHHEKTRRELIDWYRSDSDPIDWREIADRLRATGRPVPDDLFDQPAR